VRGTWRAFFLTGCEDCPPISLRKSVGGKKAYLCSYMSTWHDIDVNLLSNAIWALGGYVISQLPFLKKSFPGRPRFSKKISTYNTF
jgi:hypothetical protein